jgi:uncharacterized protein (PEP-CTERM system associated)
VAYNDKEIGLIPGVSWRFDLAYRMRRSAVKVGYFEEVTSYQYLQLQQINGTVLTDSQGNPVVDPVTNQPLVTIDQLLVLTNENFLREHVSFSMNHRTQRSDISLSGYAETRKYDNNPDDERLYDMNVAWQWQLARTMNLLAQIEGQRRKKSTDVASDKLWLARLALSRRLSPSLSGIVEARYAGRDAGLTSIDYREKRLMVSISKQF